MAMTSLRVQFEAILFLASDFRAKRRELGKSLRVERYARGLSLREVAPEVRLSFTTIAEIERGRTWSERSVGKLVRFYEKAA